MFTRHQSQQDEIQVRIRGKNNILETKTGSVTRTNNQIEIINKRKQEIEKTTERLRVLEQLEKYREDRINQEIEKYELERKKDEEEM